MLIGIVADTHDDAAFVESAVETFEYRDVAAVCHCGDVVAPFTAARFDLDAEVYAVRGNNDGEWALAETVDEFGTYLGEFGELEFGGATIALYHGTSESIVDALVDCGSYDYVCHGHTHQRAHDEHDGTVRINPGGIPFEAAPDQPAVALLNTATGDVEFVEQPTATTA